MKEDVSTKMDEKSVFWGGKFVSQYITISGYGKIDIVKMSAQNGIRMLNSASGCKKEFLKGIYDLVCHKQFTIKFKNKGKGIIFLIDDSICDRKSIVQTIHATAQTAKDACIMQIKQNHIHNRTTKEKLIRLKKVVVLARQIACLFGTLSDKLVFLYTALLCSELFGVLDKKMKNSPSLMVMFCETNFIPSIVVQYCRLCEIKTATLQEGVFMEYRGGADDIYQGIDLKCILSDYFLTWSRYTYDVAVKGGVNKERIHIVGNPRCLLAGNKIQEKNGVHGVFGVALGAGIGLSQENIRLIKMANELACHFNMKYVIRFHPGEMGVQEQYTNEYYTKNTRISSMSVDDYVNMVDFTIMVSGGLYPELVYRRHRTYKLNIYSVSDQYRDIQWNSFANYKELETLVNNNEELTPQQIEYIVGPDNLEERYRKFFQTFCIN